jgi:alcohol dehydrogenase
MQAAVVPAVKSRWKVQNVSTADPGPNQVLIRIHASGLCFTDVHQTNGELPGSSPRILGHEPVGEIVAVGAGVRTRRVGDRVGVPWVQASCGRCEWCLRGRSMFCPDLISTGHEAPGGHAEYMPAYADATMLLPEGLSYVVGIGGPGHLAVQYAKAAGFETIAISHSPDKDRAYVLGAASARGAVRFVQSS